MGPTPKAENDDRIARLLHECRQPLSVIGLSAAYLHLAPGAGEAKVREQAQLIQKQVERLGLLIEKTAAELRGSQDAAGAQASKKPRKSSGK